VSAPPAEHAPRAKTLPDVPARNPFSPQRIAGAY